MAVSGPSDRVPDLVGMSVEEAEAALAEHGMTAEVDDDVLPLDDIPAHHVAQQNPGAGTALKRVRVVRLMLSSGPPLLELPSLVGDSRSRALIALQQQELEVDFVAVAPSYTVPRDTIIAQQPEPGDLEVGSTAPLRLLSSLGPPVRHYVMVDLVGRPVAIVRPYLESLGFRVSEGPNRRLVANVAPGTIVSHTPRPGFKIAEGGQIVLQVSR